MFTAAIALVLGVAQDSGRCKVDLISEQKHIAAGKPFWVGVRFRPDPKWHIYWTNPGDSGLAADIHWKLPSGFTATQVLWPAPHRFVTEGIVNYGYGAEAIALAQIRPPASLRAGSTITLKADASWMACADMCVLGSATVQVQVRAAAKPSADLKYMAAFSAARSALPVSDPELDPTFSLSSGNYVLSFKTPEDRPIGAYFYSNEPGVIAASEGQSLSVDANGDGRSEITLKPGPAGQPKQLNGVLRLLFSQIISRALDVKAPYRD